VLPWYWSPVADLLNGRKIITIERTVLPGIMTETGIEIVIKIGVGLVLVENIGHALALVLAPALAQGRGQGHLILVEVEVEAGVEGDLFLGAVVVIDGVLDVVGAELPVVDHAVLFVVVRNDALVVPTEKIAAAVVAAAVVIKAMK
jgi:hypothetical protein